ncbi:cob(I)yrinic acid a,c-diamide adenosyltransferase [Acidianus sulfidivorans JP7]|uniref:Cob(I)yrinic acid a,c-diamide adenosyltransferase n=1 Tax=Acidianus sulfidivorans JP7 TaxID=619593 RepID=A0A2U9INU4_9CREN|nr:cob(I)yrinic acid a,c-diamide adenosyltransferase [Acidianus sulfidivorans]AWR97682.1 cob(I)yrinic acid a,c-diamide adenosyltransferase [Acidianus sulfidivorans JP7]
MIWYTGTGDSGKTKVPSKGEVWKDDDIVDALGNLDELNATLGIVSSLYPELSPIIEVVQNDIFTISSEIAGFELNFSKDRLEFLENEIAKIGNEIKPLRNFVLPGGHIASSYLHFSRAVCRRAERSLVKIYRENKAKHCHIVYLNRLSSLLFVLALWVNERTSNPNIIWKKFG